MASTATPPRRSLSVRCQRTHADASRADVKESAAQRIAALEREYAELIGAAERDDIRLYSAATKAGWSTDELRKIGFEAPAKTPRVTRKRATAARSTTTTDGTA